MGIGILIIGDEILSGRRQDKHLAKSIALLNERGLGLDWARLVGDDAAHLVQQFREIRSGGDICFSFGGIGATPDDLTRACVANAYGVELVRHVEAKTMIEEIFGAEAYPHRILMADLPAGSRLIPNSFNRIPGFSIDTLHCLPGFPQMSGPMMEWVLDHEYAHLKRTSITVLSVTVYDVAESALIPLMDSLLAAYPEVKIFSLPHYTQDNRREVELGVKGEAKATTAAFAMIENNLTETGLRFTVNDA